MTPELDLQTWWDSVARAVPPVPAPPTPTAIGLAAAAGIPAAGAVPAASRRALRDLARAHAAEIFESVRGLARGARDERVRLQAAQWLGEMGEGRPVSLSQSDVTLTTRRTGAEFGDAELLALRRPSAVIDAEPVPVPAPPPPGAADAAA